MIATVPHDWIGREKVDRLSYSIGNTMAEAVQRKRLAKIIHSNLRIIQCEEKLNPVLSVERPPDWHIYTFST